MIISAHASPSPPPMSGTVISIDSLSCPLAGAESRLLARAIRSRYRHESVLDAPARACLELADRLAAQGTSSSSGAPLRISELHVEGLCGDVLDADLVRGSERLSALYRTLRRYRGEPVR